MKKIIAMALCIVLALSLAGCGAKEEPQVSISNDIETNEKAMDTKEETKLVNIVDLAEANQLSTSSALEEFFKDTDFTYYFPSIKSEYIECQFSDGSKMTIVQALESGKVSVSDLDIYGIKYWIMDKDGNITNGKEYVITKFQEICDGLPLAPEGFSKP